MQDNLRLPQTRSQRKVITHITTLKNYTIDDRPEREFDWLLNPSAPLTDEALERFIEEHASVLLETLNKLEAGRDSHE